LVALGGDVTADIVPGIGHEPHPELIDRALGHLQTFLPRRVWAEAMAEAPLVATRADSRDLDRPATPPAANDPG
jgi:phospholipase/carboxylesterase